MQTEVEYESRTDAGRTYACYDCAMPTEQLKYRLSSASTSCKMATSELQMSRSTVAIQHVRVLDSLRGNRRLLRQRMIEEGEYLYTMYKRVAFLMVLEEQYISIQKALKLATVKAVSCLHRYDKMGAAKIYGGSA